MSGTTTIAALPVAVSIADSDLVIVEEIGSPNVTKRGTAAQMRAGLVRSTGPATISGGLTVTSGGVTVTGDSRFNDQVTMNGSGGWSSSNVTQDLLLKSSSGANPGLGIADSATTNLWGFWNDGGTLRVSSMPAMTNSISAPGNVIAVTKTDVSITGKFTTSNKLTVSAQGIDVTGNSTITGALGGLTGLTVVSGGASITGNSTISGTLGGLTGLTVASGGAAITGNSTITGTLGSLSGLTVASGAATFNSTASFNGTVTFGTNVTHNGVETFNAQPTMVGLIISGTPFSQNLAGWSMIAVGTGAFGPAVINYGMDAGASNLVANAYYAVSDSRRKRDRKQVTPEAGLSWCLGLIPETFEKLYGNDMWHREAGFIAQQVARISPEYVGTIARPGTPELIEDDGFVSHADHELSFNYQNCHAYEVAAIKRLSQMVDDLRTEIASLKARG